jgi:hypothetical protein
VVGDDHTQEEDLKTGDIFEGLVAQLRECDVTTMDWAELSALKADLDEAKVILRMAPELASVTEGIDLGTLERKAEQACKTPGMRREAQLRMLSRELDRLAPRSPSRELLEASYEGFLEHQALAWIGLREDRKWEHEPMRVGENLYQVPVVVLGVISAAHAVSADGLSEAQVETTATLFASGRGLPLAQALEAALELT